MTDAGVTGTALLDVRAGTTVLEADCVSKRFGMRAVLTAASLRARAAVVTALLGRNGAGKSTLLHITTGTKSADTGIVRFEGSTLTRPTLAALARRGVFFLPDRDLLHPSLTVGAQLQAVAEWFGSTSTVQAVAQSLGIAAQLSKRPRSLSGGERRRAEVAVAVLREPRVLMLDEPLRGIQPLDAELIMATLKDFARSGGAVVLTGHELPLILPHVDCVTWCASGTTREFSSPDEATRDFAFQRDFLGSI